MKTRQLLRRDVLCLAMAACASLSVAAQPSAVVKVLVGSPPGALGDVVARLIAEKMGQQLGAVAIVDNKAGAAGIIAADIVAKSAGDGTALLVAADNVMTVNPLIYSKLPYAQRDFTPVGTLGTADLVLVASPASGIRTMQDLVRRARINPDTITYSSGGIGHATHLGLELIAARLGLKLRHVPYKGTSPALAAVIGGETDLMFLGASGALPQIRSTRVVALAASGPNAKATFASVPLLSDFHRDLDISVWFGLFVSSKTAPDAVVRLNRALNLVLERPEVVETFSDIGMSTKPGPPSALAALIKADTIRFDDLVKTLNIKVE